MEQQKLNPTIVYVLAILGFLCCCIGGLGFILAGIAFIIATSKLNAVKLNPENYDPNSIKAMNTAKIVALVILIINLLYFIMTIYRIYTIGWDELMQQSQEMMEQWQQNQ
ncbi:CCC motif membrane protein [Flavivirga spongiicola]|uniref:CCC motif membrane protein n=1 Tax=Flavivirga spongiicola TaxID=421621 RepID=A0ABU7XM98_9FLAO|nr:CCC motif membrane protein [Flavivirga sp. MEBiC05379]MDO5981319.1 CCC motif membrane protein [Flavivirga sp. MEBiC05379]